MCCNWSLVWHSNKKIHIIDNVKAPTVSSCFKFNGAEIVNSLFFTGVFSLAATAESSTSQHPGFPSALCFASSPALLKQKIAGNRAISTFSSCLNYLVEPSVCDMWHSFPVGHLLQHGITRKRVLDLNQWYAIYWLQIFDKLLNLWAVFFSTTWRVKPTYCEVDGIWQGHIY